MKREKTIAFTITEKEFEKIKQLAEIRHMNPTEYSRHVALGNRIKPTVVSPNYKRGEDLSDLEKELEILRLENEQLKEYAKINYEKVKSVLKAVKQIQGAIADNGFVDWKLLSKEDKEALIYIRNLKFDNK